MANNKQFYLKEKKYVITKWLNDKKPLTEIARYLNVKYDTLKRFLIKEDIPFETNQNRKGIPHLEIRKTSMYYIENNISISASKLRKKLIEDGLKEYKCECCGLTEWNGKPIPLELHHINGNHYDNNFDNLEILCCNCHGQKHNYCEIVNKLNTSNNIPKTKKHKEVKIHGYCENCGKPLYNEHLKFCSQECFHKAYERLNYSKDFIIKILKENKSYIKSGRVLGISDKTFKKWCDKYGINKKNI
jgi:ribosomal protein L37E